MNTDFGSNTWFTYVQIGYYAFNLQAWLIQLKVFVLFSHTIAYGFLKRMILLKDFSPLMNIMIEHQVQSHSAGKRVIFL